MLFCNLVLIVFLLSKFNLSGEIRDTLGNIDSPIVFSLTLLQTFIALGAFIGFWMIRSSAEAKASEVAQKVATERMESFVQQEGKAAYSPKNEQSIPIDSTSPIMSAKPPEGTE